MSKTEKTSPTPSAPGKPDAARRALLRGAIKGAALAPAAIVTLKSGSAWAAAASVTCYQRTYVVQNAPGTSGNLNVFLKDPFTGAPTTQISQREISNLCWASGGDMLDIPRVRPTGAP